MWMQVSTALEQLRLSNSSFNVASAQGLLAYTALRTLCIHNSFIWGDYTADEQVMCNFTDNYALLCPDLSALQGLRVLDM